MNLFLARLCQFARACVVFLTSCGRQAALFDIKIEQWPPSYAGGLSTRLLSRNANPRRDFRAKNEADERISDQVNSTRGQNCVARAGFLANSRAIRHGFAVPPATARTQLPPHPACLLKPRASAALGCVG